MKCSRCGCTVPHENELDKLEAENEQLRDKNRHLLEREAKLRACIKKCKPYVVGWQETLGNAKTSELLKLGGVMDEQEIDREMVFKQMKKIAELKQQLQELKQREAKLRECVKLFLDNVNYYDGLVWLDIRNKAEQCLKELEK